MRAWFERAVSEGARRFGRGLPGRDSRQGARHAARPAAGRDAVERRHLRHGPGVRGAAAADARASAGRGPRRRPTRCSPSCGKVIPAFLTRVDQPERGGRWSRYLADTRARTAEVARRLDRRRGLRGRGRRGDARPISIRTARSRSSPPRSTPRPIAPDAELLALARRDVAGRSRGRSSRPTSASARTGGTSPAARSSARATASTSSPTTARSATCSVTGC